MTGQVSTNEEVVSTLTKGMKQPVKKCTDPQKLDLKI